MLTVIATLPFLAALALAALTILSIVHDSGAKIIAALAGRSQLSEATFATRPVKVRFSARQVPARRSVRVAPQLRAAA
jgi:hypothetical protein